MSDPEELLDIKEAARLLRVSETSLRRWTNSGALPHLRIGRRRERRFRRSDLLAFLEAPAGAASAAPPGPAGSGFVFGGCPAGPGTHLCGLFSSDIARIAQAVEFLAEALQAGSLCLVVTAPKARRGILAELARRVPSFGSALRSRQFVSSSYAASYRAQVEYFESELASALRAGFKSLCVLGDLSAGGPERAKDFARILEYEGAYERRVARRFPVATLCQYDARRLSGSDALGALQCHPDAFRYSAGSLLV